jgi:hypothetical protein
VNTARTSSKWAKIAIAPKVRMNATASDCMIMAPSEDRWPEDSSRRAAIGFTRQRGMGAGLGGAITSY